VAPLKATHEFEARIPYHAEGHLVRIITEQGEGSHAFGTGPGDSKDEVDLLAWGDKHGTCLSLMFTRGVE